MKLLPFASVPGTDERDRCESTLGCCEPLDGAGTRPFRLELAVLRRRRGHELAEQPPRRCRDGELSAGEIAEHFDVTGPAVSQHLTVLKEAGLVSERRNGTRRLYRARPEGLGELKAFFEEFWDERLDALKREAEREERAKR